ncbi:MAG TPA: hypothetical protein DER09_00130 [Prolixibacteraceae bacterium]|nr:hypothetical protein [Prolixibacteraceae bacterium]
MEMECYKLQTRKQLTPRYKRGAGGMNKFFDYIFYRVYKQYERWREDYPYPFAEGVVVVIQGFLVYSFLVVLTFFDLFPKNIEIGGKIPALLLLVIIYLINHNRYKNRFVEIINAYDKLDDPNRKRKGIFIVVLIIAVILFPMIIGVLRNNFNYDF